MAFCKLSGVCSSKNIQVDGNLGFLSLTDSNAHHFAYAITGVPQAIASIGTIQKSSSEGKKTAFALLIYFLTSVFVIQNIHSIFGFDLALSSLYSLLLVAVVSTILLPFLLNVSTRRSNFL